MSLGIPGSGESFKLLTGNRILTKDNFLITPQINYLSRWYDSSQPTGTVSEGTVGITSNRTVDTTSWANTGSSQTNIEQSVSTALRGTSNYRFTFGGNFSGIGTGGQFVETPVFTIDSVDLGKPISISFDFTGLTSDVNFDVAVVRYNSAGTYQETIPVAGNASTATVRSAKLPTGTGSFRGFFVPSSTATDLYALRFRRLAGTDVPRIDTLYVGPQTQLSGAAVTDWQSYTPTFTAFGTVTNNRIQQARVGPSLKISGTFSSGTPTAGAALMTLPAGLTGAYAVDTVVGRWENDRATASGLKSGTIFYSVSNNDLRFGLDDYTTASAPLTVVSGNTVSTGSASVVHVVGVELPIIGWSSNVTMADRAVEEYAYNTSTSTTASDLTSFQNGAGGALIRSITAALIRRVRFQTAIQPTDSIIVEVSPDQLRWFPISNGYTDNATFSVNNFQQQSTLLYGLGYPKVINSTDVDVNFGQYSDANGATYAVAGRAWSVGGGALYWRVRKVSGGASVGFPVGARNIVGDTSGTAVPAGLPNEEIKAARTTIYASGAATAGTYYDVTGLSVTLTPGNWDIYVMNVIYTEQGAAGLATGVTSLRQGPTALQEACSDSGVIGSSQTATHSFVQRVNISATTVYKVSLKYNISSGTPVVSNVYSRGDLIAGGVYIRGVRV